jgi:diadenosine tetraphosphatase ApaH/serine/threonine PP2A family protein phosphatase
MKYAIITDIHANYGALQAVDADVRQLRTHNNERIDYWFLGDLVGYGPDPVACIKWLKTKARIGERWVPGNHDEWLTMPTRVSEEAWTSLNKHQEILKEPLNRRYGQWFREEVKKAIVDEARSLVRESWPDQELEAFFVHAALQPSQRRTTYLKPWKQFIIGDTMELIQREYQTRSTTVLFCGHTHFPMWFHNKSLRPLAYSRSFPLTEGVHIINPGSVGQPRDGDPRAAYLLFDPENRTVEFRRVAYEATAVADRLLDNGYLPSLADRLICGDGRVELQEFHTVYRPPQWDLYVVD